MVRTTFCDGYCHSEEKEKCFLCIFINYLYFCRRETGKDAAYCFVVAIGSVCANAGAIVGSRT